MVSELVDADIALRGNVMSMSQAFTLSVKNLPAALSVLLLPCAALLYRLGADHAVLFILFTSTPLSCLTLTGMSISHSCENQGPAMDGRSLAANEQRS